MSSLQGDLSQNQRQTALNGFREGKYRILIATDIAARGIDVTRISHVINYDMPDTVEAYTHRIGRTGRATKSGDAFSFVTSEERDLVDSIEYVLGKQIARCTLEDFDYSRPARAGSGRVRHPMRMPAISELPTRFRSSTPVKKTASYHMSPGASGRRSR